MHELFYVYGYIYYFIKQFVTKKSTWHYCADFTAKECVVWGRSICVQIHRDRAIIYTQFVWL